MSTPPPEHGVLDAMMERALRLEDDAPSVHGDMAMNSNNQPTSRHSTMLRLAPRKTSPRPDEVRNPHHFRRTSIKRGGTHEDHNQTTDNQETHTEMDGTSITETLSETLPRANVAGPPESGSRRSSTASPSSPRTQTRILSREDMLSVLANSMSDYEQQQQEQYDVSSLHNAAHSHMWLRHPPVPPSTSPSFVRRLPMRVSSASTAMRPPFTNIDTRRSFDLPDSFRDTGESDSDSYNEPGVDTEYENEDEDDNDDHTSAISDGEVSIGRQFGWHEDYERTSYSQSETEGYDDGDDEHTPEAIADDEFESERPNESLSTRDINVTKAIALKNAMTRNLLRLGFREFVVRTALDAGTREIEQYDGDCELAYVDIFMTLIKMVCDAHQSGPSSDEAMASQSSSASTANQVIDMAQTPFKWPVFDMAQFEFGNARIGTCFDSVCVLINLPKVAMDRTEELMEILSCQLFSMIGDPIQVVIPSVSATGRTKGHAFLEFDDPAMARRCAAAVDGLTWGRGPFGRIRASLFRQYQVKSPVLPPPQPAQTYQQGEDNNGPRDSRSLLFHRALARDSMRLSGGGSHDGDQGSTPVLSRADLSISGVSSNGTSGLASSLQSSSVAGDDEARRRAVFGDLVARRAALLSSRGFDRSSDDMMQLGDLGLSSDDDHDGDEDVHDEEDDSSMTESDLELAEQMMEFDTHHPRFPLRVDAFHDSLSSYSMMPQPPLSVPSMSIAPPPATSSIQHESDGPWRSYCEELIARNREMQEQLAYARRRITALGHNNQKLHLLIDRMERDRDALVFENDLLQTQLRGYEDNERQQETLMEELSALRRRMKRHDDRMERAIGGVHTREKATHGSSSSHKVVVNLEGGTMVLEQLEDQLTENIMGSRRLDDLKEWEQMLESSLTRVRSIKEEIALELQKRLAQQTENEQVPDQKLCVICLSNEKSILCLPCRHLCLCQECSQHQELDKCPICRLAVEHMLQVYA